VTAQCRFTASLLLVCLPLIAAGCASSSDDGADGSASDLSAAPSAPPAPYGEGVLYFHGMKQAGIDPKVLVSAFAGRDVSTPKMSDAELQAPIKSNLLSFLSQHESDVVSGYSLGRVPVLRLMKSKAAGMKRVVLIDPTYDNAAELGKDIGGPIAKAWLAGDEERTFMLVYGDETLALKGQESYTSALTDQTRGEVCYIPGSHERFAKPDMAYALVAKDCEDLIAHVNP
jgi:hypothetical protein